MGKFLRYFSVLSLLVATLLSTSCSEEFLTREPWGVAAGSVISSPDGVEAVLIAAYSCLQGRHMFGGALCTDWMYGSIPSDDSYQGSYPFYPPLERYEGTPSHYYIRLRWQDCYNGVAAANRTLEQLIPQSTLPEAHFSRRALRAAADGDFSSLLNVFLKLFR